MTKQDPLKTHPAYLDAHCAGWLGWSRPQYPADGVAQQASDRGYWDGSKAREAAGH